MMLSQGPFFVISVMRSRWWTFGVLGCEIYGFTGGITGITAILSMFAIGKFKFLWDYLVLLTTRKYFFTRTKSKL